MVKLEPRPDMAPGLTTALNTLIEAYQTGNLKGVAITAQIARLNPETSEVGLRPMTVLTAANSMVRALVRDEMGLLLDEARLDEIMSRKQAAVMAQQAARHAEEDAKARSTILSADGTPLTH